MKEFDVIVENKVGALRDAALLLAERGVNIKAISSEANGDIGRMRLIVDKELAAREALSGAGYTFEENNIIVLTVEDKPGELVKYATRLADAGINMSAVYLAGKTGNKADIAFVVDDFDKAMRVCYAGESSAI